MREAYQYHEEPSNERPIGRFLNSLDDNSSVGMNDHEQAMDFCRQFKMLYGKLFHRDGLSSIVKARLDENNEISIEKPLATLSYSDTIWVELNHHDSPSEKERYIWKVSGGSEHYDLEIRDDYWLATYSQKGNQNQILRRYPIYNEEHVRGLANMVEKIITHPDCLDQIDDIVDNIDDSTEELKALENSPNDLYTAKRSKRIAELRSHLFRAGFGSGSVDRSNQKPLL